MKKDDLVNLPIKKATVSVLANSSAALFSALLDADIVVNKKDTRTNNNKN